MKTTGYTWNEEYQKRFNESPRVRAHLAEFIAQASQPKSPETRLKMSQAKLGKAKTAEHRERMSEAHKFRQSLRREIVARNPELEPRAVWDLVRMAQAEATE